MDLRSFEILNAARKALLDWFSAHQRPLPWRGTDDPYRIWLSEIILQQTRVEQGLPYYLRFTENYPNVHLLAQATEQEVLRRWQGLGYYSRGRNLHKTAKIISEQYGGHFPEKYEEVRKLKGIGPYTAAAILSIAFNQPYAVLDGNVARVISRLFDDATPANTPAGQRHFTRLAQELLAPEQPGDWNEAMMELGALICTPRSPHCRQCPVREWCSAFANGRVEMLPVKKPKAAVRERFFHYFVVPNEEGLYLHLREAGDIWQGLYDFPLIEMPDNQPPPMEDVENLLGINNIQPYLYGKRTHILTHQRLNLFFYTQQLQNGVALPEGRFTFVSYSGLDEYPLPKPVADFIRIFVKSPGLF